MRNSLLESLTADRLIWLHDLGIGYYPVKAGDGAYDRAYWEKYRGYDQTRMGERLTQARVDLVKRHLKPGHDGSRLLVDVGIGGGRFVDDMQCFGYDINPHAKDWLMRHGLYLNPWQGPVAALTFWDSLEHIHDPMPLLANAREFVFVSCPIFENAAHARRSKHYRTDEHCWYFTWYGLVMFMKRAGFALIHDNLMEQDLGREDIGTFVFERVKD